MHWIPKQIVAMGEDFYCQVGDGKVRTTLDKVRWEGCDKKDDTLKPITHLQGCATMANAFKESHAKDLEKLALTAANSTKTCQTTGLDQRKTSSLHLFMTSLVRKASFTIGLGVCQGILISTKRTPMSLGCGDSSLVSLHLDAG
jgi:hypothetical protein